MPTEYVIDKEIDDAVVDMLSDETFTEFSPLRDNEVKIMTCAGIHLNAEGEDEPCKGEPVILKKVPPVEKLFLDADYILIVHNSAWKTANSDIQQRAMLHRGLMKIDVEVTEKGGIKKGSRKPNIVEFTETIIRFGPYNGPLLDLREAMTIASKRVVKELQN